MHTPTTSVPAVAPNTGLGLTTNTNCVVAAPSKQSQWNSKVMASIELGFQNRSTVGIYVKEKLFPNIKFLSEDMIGFNTEEKSFCQHVIRDMNVTKADEKRWWGQHEILEFEAMRRRRNECQTSMKPVSYTHLTLPTNREV